MNKIALDKLCITASSLNSVLRYKDHAPHILQKEMHKMAISTIRRMVEASGEDNPIFQAGHIAEDSVVCDYYQGDIFIKQKECDISISIDNHIVPFHATLDVYDYISNTITEIKSIQKKRVPQDVEKVWMNCATNGETSHGKIVLEQWINNEYCSDYDTQAQIQMLCLPECYKFFFHIFYVAKNLHCLSKQWKKNPNFLQENKKIILEYWNTLKDCYQKFTDNNKNIQLEVFAYEKDILEEKRKEFYSGSFDYTDDYALRQKVDDFEALCMEYKKISELKKEKESELLSIITPCMESKGLEVAKINNIAIKKSPVKVTMKYKEIVLEKKIIPTLTEEELEYFSSKSENVYTIRFVKQKKDFFDIENAYLETGICCDGDQ